MNEMDIARYFLRKDERRELFNRKVITKNGRRFYEGNARLNKYLHLAQNIYIAKTGNPLFNCAFYAYDNGAVAPRVQENYSVLLEKRDIGAVEIPKEQMDFLDRIFIVFQNASLDELIELSHEDSEWRAKQGYYSKEDQRMDSMSRAAEYKEQYADIVKIMDRLEV